MYEYFAITIILCDLSYDSKASAKIVGNRAFSPSSNVTLFSGFVKTAFHINYHLHRFASKLEYERSEQRIGHCGLQ